MKGDSSFVNQVNEGILAILANKNGKMGGLLNIACKLHTYMYVQIIIKFITEMTQKRYLKICLGYED